MSHLPDADGFSCFKDFSIAIPTLSFYNGRYYTRMSGEIIHVAVNTFTVIPLNSDIRIIFLTETRYLL